jgi:hypothetical protein
MNYKILALLAIVPLLLMPLASSYAVSGSEKMSMKDNASMKKRMAVDPRTEKMQHMEQQNIPNPYFFQIEETSVKMKRGTVTISGHGAYNPDEGTIVGWGKYYINMGSRVINGNWKAINLVSGSGNPYADDSSDSKVHFVGMTANKRIGGGENSMRESIKRGGHQIWISADVVEGMLCVYGVYVGTPAPRDACVKTDTVSITK